MELRLVTWFPVFLSCVAATRIIFVIPRQLLSLETQLRFNEFILVIHCFRKQKFQTPLSLFFAAVNISFVRVRITHVYKRVHTQLRKKQIMY